MAPRGARGYLRAATKDAIIAIGVMIAGAAFVALGAWMMFVHPGIFFTPQSVGSWDNAQIAAGIVMIVVGFIVWRYRSRNA